MKTKNIELRNKPNRKNFYEFVCGGLVIGSLKRSSINQWIIYPELPNFKTNMVICGNKDEGVSLMEEKLNELIKQLEKNDG